MCSTYPVSDWAAGLSWQSSPWVCSWYCKQISSKLDTNVEAVEQLRPRTGQAEVQSTGQLICPELGASRIRLPRGCCSNRTCRLRSHRTPQARMGRYPSQYRQPQHRFKACQPSQNCSSSRFFLPKEQQFLPSFVSVADDSFQNELELSTAVNSHVSVAPVVAKIARSCPQRSGDLAVLSELHVE